MRPATRRAALRLGCAAILRGRYRLFGQNGPEYSARTVRLLEENPVVDLLNQFRFEDFADKPPKIDRWLDRPETFNASEARPYIESRIDVFALGSGTGDYESGIRFFARWNGFLAAHPDLLMRIGSVADIRSAHASRRIGVMITLQDSTHFRTPRDVDEFFGLGQRISQLTYNFNNRIGSGFLERRDGGLSVFGSSIMKRMEEVGMAVDVSHCADQTTLDALDAATKPVLFTHATCRTLIPNLMRAKTDDAIRRMAKTSGVMGIDFIRFMVRDREPVGIDDALNHFDYVRKLVGVEHLAIGSDLDLVGNGNPVNGPGGFNPMAQPNFHRYGYHVDRPEHVAVTGLDHAMRVFNLTDGLIRRGYSDAEIGAILGGNAIRVLGGIWPSA
ncbi:MAG: membrane dipeptidase [Acidobacteriota bacterium]|nr:membrane dipeptidase [Acidobacteriota bacterium]